MVLPCESHSACVQRIAQHGSGVGRSLQEEKVNVCWFKISDETTEVLRESGYGSIEGFDSRRNETCTTLCLKAKPNDNNESQK